MFVVDDRGPIVADSQFVLRDESATHECATSTYDKGVELLKL